MNKFSAEFYTKTTGEKPAKDFLLSQEPKMKAKLNSPNIIEQIF